MAIPATRSRSRVHRCPAPPLAPGRLPARRSVVVAGPGDAGVRRHDPHAHVVDEVLFRGVEAEVGRSPRPAIGLFGIGMGGQRRLQYRVPARADFAVVAAISLRSTSTCCARETILDELFESPEAARQENGGVLHRTLSTGPSIS